MGNLDFNLGHRQEVKPLYSIQFNYNLLINHLILINNLLEI